MNKLFEAPGFAGEGGVVVKTFQRFWKGTSVVALVVALLGSGLVVSTGAGAATPKPAYEDVCGTIAGNYVCGTIQWMDAAQTAANNAMAAAQANEQALKNDVCNSVNVLYASFGALAVFFPESEIVAWIVKALVGVSPAAVYGCWA